MGFQEDLYQTEAKGGFGDVPHDNANGRYLFRILEVVRTPTRKAGWVLVTTKQVIAVLSQDATLRRGDIVKELISSKSESCMSSVKRWLGKLYGFDTDEQINDKLSQPGIRWADLVEQKGNSFARDMVIDQTLKIEEVDKKVNGQISYDAMGKPHRSTFTRRTFNSIVPAAGIPQEAMEFFPDGPREQRGLPPFEPLPAPVAAPQMPAQQQYQAPQTQQYQVGAAAQTQQYQVAPAQPQAPAAPQPYQPQQPYQPSQPYQPTPPQQQQYQPQPPAAPQQVMQAPVPPPQ